MAAILYTFMTIGVYFFYYSLDKYTWFGTMQMFPFSDQWITPESYFYLLAGYMARVFFFLAMGHLVEYVVKILSPGSKRFDKWIIGFLILCVFEIVATVNFTCRFGKSFWLNGFDTLTIRAIIGFIVAAVIITSEQISKYETK